MSDSDKSENCPRQRRPVLIWVFNVAFALLLLWVVIVDMIVSGGNTRYYPGVEFGGVTLWPGPKFRQLIGYDERQNSWPSVDRIWHQNGELYEDTKAYDENGNEVPLYSEPRPYMSPPRLENAFFREVTTRWNEQGRKTFEIEIRRGRVVRQTSFWAENEHVRHYFDMNNSSWDGTEKVFSRSGVLVYEGRWKAGEFVESVSGDPESEERHEQARQWSRKK